MDLKDLIASASAETGIPETYLAAQIQQESSGRPDAVSPVGAIGLMQILPKAHPEYTGGFDPQANIEYGSRYMKQLLDRFEDPAKAIAAYNAGPGRVRGLVRKHGDDWLSFAPQETQKYVEKLLPAYLEAPSVSRTPLSIEINEAEPPPDLPTMEREIQERERQKKADLRSELDILRMEEELGVRQLPVAPSEDDGWINNSWEVLGSGIEQGVEQIVQTIGDLSERPAEAFEESTGLGTGRFVLGDSEYVRGVNPDRGFRIPFTNKVFGYVNSEEFQKLDRLYEAATGNVSSNLVQDFDLPDVDRPDSALGQMASSMVQFGLAFALTKKTTGMGVFGTSVVADFAAFDPHEARLSDMLTRWGTEGDDWYDPALANAVTEYLASDEDDTKLEGRLKNALEGVFIGAALDLSVRSFKWLKARRIAREAESSRKVKARETLEPEGPPKADEAAPESAKVDDIKKPVVKTVGTQTEFNLKKADELVAALKESLAERRANGAATKTVEKDLGVAERKAAKLRKQFDEEQAAAAKADAEAPKADEEAPKADDLSGEKKAYDPIESAALAIREQALRDPAKAKQVAKLLEEGKLSEAEDLLDFNADTIDWEGIATTIGEPGSDDVIRRLINTVSEVYDTANVNSGKPYQSLKETLSKSVGTTLDDVRHLSNDTDKLAQRLAGARSLLYSSAQKLRELAIAARDNPTAANEFALLNHIELHGLLQAKVKGSGREIARALHAMREMKVAGADQFREMDDVLMQIGGKDPNMRRRIAQKFADLEDLNIINKEVRKSRWRRYAEVAIEVYINGLLSALSTLNLNNLSNSLKVVEGITEKYLAVGLGVVKNTGRRAVGLPPSQRLMLREANAHVLGTIHGLDRAMRISFKGLWDIARAGEWDSFRGAATSLRAMHEQMKSTSNVYRAFSEENAILDTRMRVDTDTRKAIQSAGEGLDAKAINALGKLVRLPGRLILTSDEFFKNIAYHQHLAAWAYKQADDQIAALKEAGKPVPDRAKLVNELMKFPPEDLRFDAMDYARYQTFQSDLVEGGMARDLEKYINRHPLMRFVIPFYRTPVNIVKQTIVERTPVGLLKLHHSHIWKQVAAGGPQADIALARLATGSMFLGTAMMWGMSGKITGSGSSNVLNRNTEALDKIPPYSIEIGGRWYQYNRLEPLGMLMGLGADLAEASMAWDGEDPESDWVEAANVALTVVTTNVTDKTWFKGVADLVSAVEDPKRFLRNYTLNMTTTMVTPYSSLLRRINTDHDELAREAWTWMDKWKANIPGLSDELAVRYDILGQPMQKRDYLGAAWLSPIAVGDATEDPVYQELARLAFDYRKPNRDLFSIGRDLSAADYADVMRRKGTVQINGRNLKEELDHQMNSYEYVEVLSDDGRATLVRNVISAYLNTAKADFIMDNPDFFTEFEEAKIGQKMMLLQ